MLIGIFHRYIARHVSGLIIFVGDIRELRSVEEIGHILLMFEVVGILLVQLKTVAEHLGLLVTVVVVYGVGRGASHVEWRSLAIGQDYDRPCVGITTVAPMRGEIDSSRNAEATAEIDCVVCFVTAVASLANEQGTSTGWQGAFVTNPLKLPRNIEQA